MKKILIYFLLILSGISFSVIKGQTERETRAVWVATNFRLDWPPARYDETIQKEALANIFDDIKKKNFNTVYFQVRFNATVLFRSSYEPLSFYITGKLGDTTGYDPLQYAIELAHKRGLELHAWVNILKCLDGTEKNLIDNPLHITKIHPDWIVKDTRDGAVSYWLDPGLPEVRHYLSGLISEMALNYDIDGVQYDYLRYPGKNFDDDFSYSVHGKDLNRDEWRRNNLTELVKELSEKIKAEKPTMKLGAAPIGIYRNMQYAKGLEGFNDVYQDSREWLKLKYIDYVVPQIYWTFEGNPRFDVLAKDWNSNSFGRSVILGIAAYKPEVYSELDKMIQLSRSINTGGVAFFRYSNIKNYDFDLFPNKAFPAVMAWLDGSKPNPPSGLICQFIEGKQDFFNLSWKQPAETGSDDSLRYFSLYSIKSPVDKPTNEDLFEIISSSKNSVSLGIRRPRKVSYFFTLKSVTKLWNESLGNSNVVKVTFPEMIALSGIDELSSQPFILKEKEGSPKILLFSEAEGHITIYLKDRGTVKKIGESGVEAGKNVISVNYIIPDSGELLLNFMKGKEVKITL